MVFFVIVADLLLYVFDEVELKLIIYGLWNWENRFVPPIPDFSRLCGCGHLSYSRVPIRRQFEAITECLSKLLI